VFHKNTFVNSVLAAGLTMKESQTKQVRIENIDLAAYTSEA